MCFASLFLPCSCCHSPLSLTPSLSVFVCLSFPCCAPCYWGMSSRCSNFTCWQLSPWVSPSSFTLFLFHLQPNLCNSPMDFCKLSCWKDEKWRWKAAFWLISIRHLSASPDLEEIRSPRVYIKNNKWLLFELKHYLMCSAGGVITASTTLSLQPQSVNGLMHQSHSYLHI